MARYGREYRGGGGRPYGYDFDRPPRAQRFTGGRMRRRHLGPVGRRGMLRGYEYGRDYGYGREYGYGRGPGGWESWGPPGEMHRAGPYDYGDTFSSYSRWGEPAGRIERGYERWGESPYSDYGGEYDRDFPSSAQVRYGHTPTGRWPEDSHVLDRRFYREPNLTDEEIRDAIRDNLARDGWIDAERIDVEVENGVATLRGEVADFMEARYAWDDAWETIGVRGVINHLTVRTDLPSRELDLPQTADGERAR